MILTDREIQIALSAGQIQLEMYNFGPHDIILDPGMRVCQLIFEQTIGTPNKGYAGGFLGQSGG